jgi:uncharacterized protein (DUF302 family)
MSPEKKSLNLKKEIAGGVEEAVQKITAALSKQGFGILTRIDFHQKMQEKLGEKVPPTVILGACNPRLAFEAWKVNTDMTSLIPCNAVVRDVGAGRVSVELAKPSMMLEALGDAKLSSAAAEADRMLASALEDL